MKNHSLIIWKLVSVLTIVSTASLIIWYVNNKNISDIDISSDSEKSIDGLFLIDDYNDDRKGYIDKSGKTIFTVKLQEGSEGRIFRGSEFHEQLACITKKIGGGRDARYEDGYINKEGKIVIDFQFDFARDFHEGVAFVKLNSKWGLIDKEGKMIINPQFDDVKDFSQGLAQFKTGNSWGYINKNGQVSIQAKFKNSSQFEDDLAAFQSQTDSKWGYINKNGEIVIKAQYDNAEPFSEGLAQVKIGEKWGYIDKKGRIVIKPRFSEVKKDEFHDREVQGKQSFSEGLAAVVENGKRFYIDKNGKTAISFQQIDNHENFSEGLATVKIGDKCGYIDTVGKMVIEPKFSSCEPFSQGLAKVYSEKDGYIDKSGKFIWKSR